MSPEISVAVDSDLGGHFVFERELSFDFIRDGVRFAPKIQFFGRVGDFPRVCADFIINGSAVAPNRFYFDYFRFLVRVVVR